MEVGRGYKGNRRRGCEEEGNERKVKTGKKCAVRARVCVCARVVLLRGTGADGLTGLHDGDGVVEDEGAGSSSSGDRLVGL